MADILYVLYVQNLPKEHENPFGMFLLVNGLRQMDRLSKNQQLLALIYSYYGVR